MSAGPAGAAAGDGVARGAARAGRRSVEGVLQVVIMLAIGGAAGAASFRHVHDVAVAHGQEGWLAWADAVVLELMSIASGLELRRRKRLHMPLRFPSTVLGVAVCLSLGAQVVEAEPSVIGWIAAAIPALGFLVMVKIALAPADAAALRAHEQGAPAVGSTDKVPGSDLTVGVGPESSGVIDEGPRNGVAGPEDPVVQVLVPAARAAARALHTQGRRVTRSALADVLRADGYGISNARASALLRHVVTEMGDELAAEPRAAAIVPSRAGGG